MTSPNDGSAAGMAGSTKMRWSKSADSSAALMASIDSASSCV